MTATVQPIRSDGGVFTSLGEQLRAIALAEQPGQRTDPRLLQVRGAAGSSEAIGADGGFLLDQEFSRALVERMYMVGDIFKRCFKLPMGRNGIKFPQFSETSRANGSRLGGVQCFPENEAVALVPTKPSFQLTGIFANKITGLIYLTDELAMDSNAFETWATYAFTQELMFTFENLIVNGTGAGEPLGVVNSNALVKMAKQVGQAAKSVNAQNVNSMLAAFWARSYNSAGSIWLFNQELLPQLSGLSTLVGTAGSESKLWQWAQTPESYDTLAGFPAIPCEYCAVPGSTGDLILADFSRYCVAVREKLRGEMSIHVKFLTDENVYRFIMRAGGGPLDQSSVVPLNGTQATSPFVALATR